MTPGLRREFPGNQPRIRRADEMAGEAWLGRARHGKARQGRQGQRPPLNVISGGLLSMTMIRDGAVMTAERIGAATVLRSANRAPAVVMGVPGIMLDRHALLESGICAAGENNNGG